jgi:hypothetical protein
MLTTTRTVIQGEPIPVQVVQNGRVFQIDAGSMPKALAEDFIRRAMAAHRSKLP